MSKATKVRLDRLLVERGLAESGARAQALVLAGRVFRGEERLDKPGLMLAADCALAVRAVEEHVSRGAHKLIAGLDAFGLDPADLICLDVGASTGGFTDVLLRRGAARVYAVDVGYGQLAWSLRQDPRVTLLERCNIRHLTADRLPGIPEVAVIDASFISLSLVLPPTVALLAPGAVVVALVKPQFEVGRGQVGGGGVVRDPALHAAAVARIRAVGGDLGLDCLGECESPLLGPKGNREFFVAWRLPAAG